MHEVYKKRPMATNEINRKTPLLTLSSTNLQNLSLTLCDPLYTAQFPKVYKKNRFDCLVGLLNSIKSPFVPLLPNQQVSSN